MKILHVCYSDSEGGAARAAYRLHAAQRKQGLNSEMLVINKNSDDIYVHTVSKFKRVRIQLFAFISKQILKLQKNNNTVYHSLNIFSSRLTKSINSIAPDILHFHF